jgi:hypothetical protein
MRINKFGEAAMGVALSATLLAGCSTSPDAPALTAPNGTIEQVENNLDYADTLGKLTLGQTVHFTAAHDQQVYIYNYTPETVDAKAVKALFNFYQKRAGQDFGYYATLYPNDPKHSVRSMITETALTYSEHDLVLVPPKTSLPRSFTKDQLDPTQEATGATKNFPEQSQVISVIKQPVDSAHNPAAINYDARLAVELCQSTIQADDADSPLSSNTLLAQETDCNSLGEAASYAQGGASYSVYRTSFTPEKETIQTANGASTIELRELSENEYGDMLQAVVPRY